MHRIMVQLVLALPRPQSARRWGWIQFETMTLENDHLVIFTNGEHRTCQTPLRINPASPSVDKQLLFPNEFLATKFMCKIPSLLLRFGSD